MRRSGTDIRRKRAYFVLMGLCLALFILAWAVVRNFSTTAAIIMSAAAVLIPPIAVMVANAGDEQRPRR
jgi:formate hydrogenlyase subunit 4